MTHTPRTPMRLCILLILCGIVQTSAAQTTRPASMAATLTAPAYGNPIAPQRADPHVYKHADGYYYFTATVPVWDRIELRRSRTIDGLRDAERVVVWRRHDTGPTSKNIWAPEIHFIDGVWYIYFTAEDTVVRDSLRMFALSNASPNPLEGKWEERGRIVTHMETPALDATVFSHRGTLYMSWSQADPEKRANCLFISAMENPLKLKGKTLRVSFPEYPWEKGRKLSINEAPAALVRHGKVILAYSASEIDASYCVGLLWADDSADLLDASSWHKSATPVFKTSEVNGQFGPGHNSFTVAEDGTTDVLIYHARPYHDAKPDALVDPNRHTRAQPFNYDADCLPSFGEPLPDAEVGRASQFQMH